jgi:hypothetical protein
LDCRSMRCRIRSFNQRKTNSMKNNPQAFPTPGVHDPTLPTFYRAIEGMTLLDWFAGQALAGISGNMMYHQMVVTAYDIAETMLIEREKRIK